MDAFEGLEPLSVTGKPALDECFVDIPDCLETTSELKESRQDQGNMVPESLLQPDYSSFFLWSSEFAQAETKGTAEIWRTGVGIMLPAESSDRTFLSSLSRRLSEETLQSSQTPFKSGYCAKSESELLAQEGEPMVFVPSTVSTSYGEGSQKLEEEVETPVKKYSRQKGKPGSKTQSSRRSTKLKVKRGPQTGVSKGTPVGRGSRRKAAESSQATDASEGSSRRENANPETPTSAVSTLPIASRRVAKPKGAVSLERKQVSSQRTALQQSSPNVPTRRASKQSVSPSAVVCATKTGEESQKPSRKRTKISFADEAESAPSSPSKKQVFVTVEHAGEEAASRPKKARRPKKNQKKTLPKESLQILKDWARSSKMIPYPDKETKQELADAAHLSVYQVDNWLAGARNRTHIIEVPQELKLLSKNLRGKACEQGAG